MQDRDLAERLRADLPGVTIHCGPPRAALPDVIMAVTSAGRPGLADMVPNLRLVQKLGAGVDGVLAAGDLPEHVMVARLASEGQAAEISEYVLGAILNWQRGFLGYARRREWAPQRPVSPADAPVTVLGLGRIGLRVAQDLAARGYPVTGWSRSARTCAGMRCLSGPAMLGSALEGAAYVVAVLPSTPETRGLFDARGLSQLPKEAVLINVGRGDLVDLSALTRALERGALRGAVLDVTAPEPLPRDSALWARDDVLITPHVSGWSVEDGMGAVSENYRRLRAGQSPINLIDRSLGY